MIKSEVQEMQQVGWLPEPVSRRLTQSGWFFIAIDRTAIEAKCSRLQAFVTLLWIWTMVRASRKRGYVEVKMRWTASKLPPYQIFNKIMPHDRYALPDSAHQAIEDTFLNRRRNEFALQHRRGNYCSFRLLTSSVL